MPQNPVLSSIKIDPDDEVITMDFGETITFNVTGLDQLANPYTNFDAQWFVESDLGSLDQNQGHKVNFTALDDHEEDFVEGEIILDVEGSIYKISVVIGEKPADDDNEDSE